MQSLETSHGFSGYFSVLPQHRLFHDPLEPPPQPFLDYRGGKLPKEKVNPRFPAAPVELRVSVPRRDGDDERLFPPRQSSLFPEALSDLKTCHVRHGETEQDDIWGAELRGLQGYGTATYRNRLAIPLLEQNCHRIASTVVRDQNTQRRMRCFLVHGGVPRPCSASAKRVARTVPLPLPGAMITLTRNC
jgi:hypothetical protein